MLMAQLIDEVRPERRAPVDGEKVLAPADSPDSGPAADGNGRPAQDVGAARSSAWKRFRDALLKALGSFAV
jgi:hypothetical protein